jgi:hypothetical protein
MIEAVGSTSIKLHGAVSQKTVTFKQLWNSLYVFGKQMLQAGLEPAIPELELSMTHIIT